MKRFLSFLALSLCLIVQVFGQAATNADGSIKFRGNVAVIANCEMFNFINGKADPLDAESKEAVKAMEGALRTLAQAKFGDMAFGIVNRDDEAAKQVQTVINENKLEDYLNGYSVQAKNQGADWLFVINMTLVNYENQVGQLYLDSRLVNVENNLGYHRHFASNEIPAKQVMTECGKVTKDFIQDLEAFLYSLFPEQYYIAESKGKKLQLGPYQTSGRILPSDKFYAYKVTKQPVKLAGLDFEMQIIEPIGVAADSKIDGGRLFVKADSKIPVSNDIVLTRNLPEISIFQPIAKVTFFGLDYDPKSPDGFARQRVNNAMLAAITDNPLVQLIEQETIEELHKERELQKSEDFLNGHTVEQMKAIGADVILKLDNYQTDGVNSQFVLSAIDVASNQIVRQTEIKSSIDDLEKAIRKNLYDRFGTRAAIGSIDKKNLTLYTVGSIPKGTTLDFIATVEQKNPLTGEVGYTNVFLASGEVISSNGQQSTVKLLSKTKEIKDYKDLLDFSNASTLQVKIDGSKISVEESKKEKNKKPKQSFWDKVGGAVEAVANGLETAAPAFNFK